MKRIIAIFFALLITEKSNATDEIIKNNGEKISIVIINDDGYNINYTDDGKLKKIYRGDVIAMKTEEKVYLHLNDGSILSGVIDYTYENDQFKHFIKTDFSEKIPLKWEKVTHIETKQNDENEPINKIITENDINYDQFTGATKTLNSSFSLEVGIQYTGESSYSYAYDYNGNYTDIFYYMSYNQSEKISISVGTSGNYSSNKTSTFIDGKESNSSIDLNSVTTKIIYRLIDEKNNDINIYIGSSLIIPTSSPTLNDGALVSSNGFWGGTVDFYMNYSIDMVKFFMSTSYGDFISKKMEGFSTKPGRFIRYNAGMAYRISPSITFASSFVGQHVNASTYNGDDFDQISTHRNHYRHDIFIDSIPNISIQPFTEFGIDGRNNDYTIGISLRKYW
ncbi:hypothetical protein [Niveispirillum sp. BGYR6]|uniref:hypothetical protein n=1 Tax=Niveispirillum sp. BGYR6 TaxID=2971249 RepID=UPI0022B95288|nr:hypothetical protein [Niveispirillum sp. BGYR6]MDG5494133.1 hypothetical protein [Niveispirillum sp. BGYR6]